MMYGDPQMFENPVIGILVYLAAWSIIAALFGLATAELLMLLGAR
jgi:hypothetical protein